MQSALEWPMLATLALFLYQKRCHDRAAITVALQTIAPLLRQVFATVRDRQACCSITLRAVNAAVGIPNCHNSMTLILCFICLLFV